MNALRRYSMLALLAVSAGLVPRDAVAAPFCVQVTGQSLQCMYFDPGECRERAHQLNGICAPNPDELKIIPGSARYCLVNAAHAALCIYPDMQSCNAVADKDRETVCIDSGPPEQQNTALVQPGQQIGAPPAIPQQEQDPFRAGEPDRRY